MSKESNGYHRIKRHRATRRDICTVAMGGKCQICGYDKCRDALEVHHIDPSEKEIAFQKIVSWDKIYAELEKCILLCANCHREVHANQIGIPDDYFRFDRVIADSMRSKQSLNSQYSNHADVREATTKKREQSRKIRNDFIENRKVLILESGIDFAKWGWATELSKLIGISSQKTRDWVKKNMPELFVVSRKK